MCCMEWYKLSRLCVFILSDGKGSKWVVGREGDGASVESTRVVVQTSVQAVFIKGSLMRLAAVTTMIVSLLRLRCCNGVF